MSGITKALTNFILSKERNKWLSVKTSKNIHIDVYMRRSLRIFEGKRYDRVIDIATITVQHDKRGQGAFTEFLDDLMSVAKEYNYKAIFVENILEPRLEEFLIKKRGFKPHGMDSVYKLINVETPHN